MRYLHLIPPSLRMMKGNIAMIQQNLNKEEHFFLTYGECALSEVSLLLIDQVKGWEELGNNTNTCLRNLKKEMEKADYIFWHNFIPRRELLLFAFFNPGLLKKTIWVSWGIDLYNWKRNEKGLKNKVINYLNKKCREKMLAINVIFPTDIEIAQEQFGGKLKIFFAPYCLGEESWKVMEHLKSQQTGEEYYFPYEEYVGNKNASSDPVTSLDESKKNLETASIKIQIGHNAYQFNNHKQILDTLRRFNEENIKLFLPISYGGDNHTTKRWYKRALKDYGKDIFNDKIVFLDKLMSQNDYTGFIYFMDVLILNSERQNGLGNLLKYLYFGKKIYMNPDNPMYSYFNKQGIKIFSTKLLEIQTIKEIAEPFDSPKAAQWINENFLPQNSAKRWKSIIEELSV